ncbi:hypothetical protein ANN_06024 [Periplaneta americana]|uniref:Uncharacterized protein n=1 Tax=Periplaneta americana TaxID=6978 RepID=A0ABQ8TDB9_PERAM|nr:hypothetical protein ANN_06024 [Periplaneta americana]
MLSRGTLVCNAFQSKESRKQYNVVCYDENPSLRIPIRHHVTKRSRLSIFDNVNIIQCFANGANIKDIAGEFKNVFRNKLQRYLHDDTDLNPSFRHARYR